MQQHNQPHRSLEKHAPVSPEAVAVNMHIAVTEEAVEYLQFITGRFTASVQPVITEAAPAPQVVDMPVETLPQQTVQANPIVQAREAVNQAYYSQAA